MNEVDKYISSFPSEIQEKLNLIRKMIKEYAPDSTERICMRIPTYDLYGKWMIHFACFKKHISIYPQPETVEAFKKELENYCTSKGTIQFPLNKELPIDLIQEIIKYRVNEHHKKYKKD